MPREMQAQKAIKKINRKPNYRDHTFQDEPTCLPINFAIDAVMQRMEFMLKSKYGAQNSTYSILRSPQDLYGGRRILRYLPLICRNLFQSFHAIRNA